MMKEWQKGISLDHLLEIEYLYKNDNEKIRSPFGQMKKHTIASELDKGSLILLRNPYSSNIEASLLVKESKVNTPIFMHGSTIFGNKEKGDIFISNVTGNTSYISRFISTNFNKNCWIAIFPWQNELKFTLENLGFRYINTKYNTFSDVILYFFRDSDLSFTYRLHPNLLETETVSMVKVGHTDTSFRFSIMEQIYRYEPKFANHYSNYNTKNAWSAFALRGYYPDPLRIEKPEEMNDKWRENHKNEIPFLQDTELYKYFPTIEEHLYKYNTKIHRVRIMKLTPGGGELQRHTDQVDPDAGTKIGQLARFHFPLETNPRVIFSTWDNFDQKQDYHFGVDEIWYLDTRKPHMAVNNGTTDRLHLVVDFEVNDYIQFLITQGSQLL